MESRRILKWSSFVFVAIIMAIVTAFSLVPLKIVSADMSTKGFGSLPIVKEKPVREKRVYLGGSAIGIDMKVGGLIVDGILPVATKNGLVTPVKECDIKKGDIVEYINGVKVDTVTSVLAIINNLTDKTVCISILRGEERLDINVEAVDDCVSGKPRLGLNLVEGVEGIGTLTFVDPDDGRFGSLGHAIIDSSTGISYHNVNGKIHSARVYGVDKGKNGHAGQLIGAFDKGRIYGRLDKNENHGVFGKYLVNTAGMEKVVVGERNKVHPGKAEIVTSVFTGKPTRYAIEIVKASRQDKEKVKGMMIRVTDPRLIDVSGGIVQGMSGSPILQNGKLIGAVTHVFISDSTKGYATYIDWMIDK